MNITIHRTYHSNAVNGELYIEEEFQCYTIELPWLNNQPMCSCIPEGKYELQKRWSPKHKWHLLVKGVMRRSFILLHSANNAQKELKGFIAPVTTLTGIGTGSASRAAFEKLLTRVFHAMKTETVFLIIKTKQP
jgi:hypothetical protein